MNNFSKTPYEIISLIFNFNNSLADTEVISSYTVICINAKTSADTKTTIVDSDTNTDLAVTVITKAGTTNDCHKITVRILSSFGNYFEIDLLLNIAEKIDSQFKKQPGSKYTISNNFDNDIDSTDSIFSKTTVVTKISDSSDVTDAILVSSSVFGSIVYATFQAGTDGEDYIISIKIVTVDGLQYEKLILMQVRKI